MRYPKYRKWLKGVLRRWWRLWNAVPILNKGKYCKRIQRKFRLYQFICERHIATTKIQKRFRIYFAHTIWASILLEKREAASNKITQCIRVISCRNKRLLLCKQRHMAAWKIQYHVRKNLGAASRKRIYIALAIKKRKEALIEKEKLTLARKMKSVEKIRNRWKIISAIRIQKRWMKYIREERKKAEVRYNRKMLKKEVVQELTEIKKQRKAVKSLYDPMILLGKASATISKFISGTDEIVSIKDRVRCLNSVLQHQTLSLELEGILELHLTLGESESHNFYKDQLKSRNEGSPYFVKLQKDLSGPLELLIFLWIKLGRGEKLICELKIDEKPRASKIFLKERAEQLKHECQLITWHPNCHIEFRGMCSIQAGLGGYPIRDIAIAYNIQEEEELRVKEYALVKDLKVFGLPSSIYMLQKKPITDNNIFELKTLDMFDWTDKRLLKCLQTYNLTVEDVLNLRWVFEDILPPDNKVSNIVSISAVLEFLHIEETQIWKWMLETVHLQDPNNLLFSEYVQLVSSFSVLSNKELIKFTFGCHDKAGRCLLKKEQFEALVDICLEGTGRSSVLYHNQYESFYRPQLKGILYTAFVAFVGCNPVILWSMQTVQIALRKYNLGDAYWFKKMEQFRLVRKELNIKQR